MDSNIDVSSIFRVLADGVLVSVCEPEKKQTGIIIHKSNDDSKTSVGVVVSVGSGRIDSDGKTIPMVVKNGDKVVFRKWGGTEVNYGDTNLICLKESDIMCIIKDTK